MTLFSFSGLPGSGVTFGGFRLEPDGTLLRGETIVHLPPKELAALKLLLSHAGQIVTPSQLRQEIWGEVNVTADSVPKCLSSLRARLEPDDCIQTVYKRGYRFTAEVRRPGDPAQEALPRLAILPFVAGYAVPEHLGQAIAEETLARLANLHPPVASVLARDSVFELARRGFTAQQVGEQLKADLALTGTLRSLPGHLRLRVEMIQVETGTQLWVEDMLAPQGIAAEVESELVGLLAFRLNGGPLAAAQVSNAQAGSQAQKDAYEIFLHARYESRRIERHRSQDGFEKLSKAAELDSSPIQVKVDLADACVAQALLGYMAPEVAAEHVHRIADSIPGFPESGEAILPALGWVRFHMDRDLPAANEAFALSAHLRGDPFATRSRVMFALSRHRFAQAIELLRAALGEDPFSPWLHGRLAWALHLAGEADESVEQVRRAASVCPDHICVLLYGSTILAYNGNSEQGAHFVRQIALLSPYLDLATAVQAYALAREGRKAEAKVMLERLQWLSRERYVLRSFTAAALVELGETDAAIAELRGAADARCPWFFQMLADPRLKPLHGHEEFQRLRAILPAMEAQAAGAAARLPGDASSIPLEFQ
jgi:DNA-binding winged helix-turn-helix (wHTH) protein/tetratricopeptide (TPR) repeat protein